MAPPQPIVDHAPERSAPSLEPLFRLMSADLGRVNTLIVERMHSPIALIPQLAGHIVSAGGKRLRPLLTLACARLCGYREGERHVAIAAVVEFIHTATLLHDDVVDASDLRQPPRQRAGVAVILRKPIDMVIEGISAGGGTNAGLAHRAAKALLPAPDLVDEIARARDDSADRSPESL